MPESVVRFPSTALPNGRTTGVAMPIEAWSYPPENPLEVAKRGFACDDCASHLDGCTSEITNFPEWEKAVAATNPTAGGEYHVVLPWIWADQADVSQTRAGTCDYCGRRWDSMTFDPIEFIRLPNRILNRQNETNGK